MLIWKYDSGNRYSSTEETATLYFAERICRVQFSDTTQAASITDTV